MGIFSVLIELFEFFFFIFIMFNIFYILYRVLIFRPRYLVTCVLKNGTKLSYNFSGRSEYKEQQLFFKGNTNRIQNINCSDGTVDVLSLYDVKNYNIVKLPSPTIYSKFFKKIFNKR